MHLNGLPKDENYVDKTHRNMHAIKCCHLCVVYRTAYFHLSKRNSYKSYICHSNIPSESLDHRSAFFPPFLK
jgi:hypothetical protein